MQEGIQQTRPKGDLNDVSRAQVLLSLPLAARRLLDFEDVHKAYRLGFDSAIPLLPDALAELRDFSSFSQKVSH